MKLTNFRLRDQISLKHKQANNQDEDKINENQNQNQKESTPINEDKFSEFLQSFQTLINQFTLGKG